MKHKFFLPALCLAVGLSVNGAMAQQTYEGSVNATGNYDNGWFFWNEVHTHEVTLEPGRGRFSIDDLGIGDNMVITLVNPSDLPMRFETVQRLGQEKRWVVPPKSTMNVNYIHTNPVNDEVKFFVTAEPSAAAAAMNQPDPTLQALDEIRNNQQQIISQNQAILSEQQRMAQQGSQENQVIQAQQPTVIESRSAVRGFW